MCALIILRLSELKTEIQGKYTNQNTINFSDQNRSYEGLIKDISSSGLFFEAEGNFEEGQILTFSAPAKNGVEARINGQIVWADDEGFGVIFIN